MFTGLIEEIGLVKGIRKQGEVMQLSIAAKKVIEGVAIGDSISVNGVCLTVTSFHTNDFTADVMPETYRKSSLSQLTNGRTVNLERAMIAGGRFGGHIVQGHVDGTGHIAARYRDGNAVVFEIQVGDRELLKYVIPKGSITIDGISLTIISVLQNVVKVSVIPHTLAQTALQQRDVGDIVNLEADIIGKYVEHLLKYQVKDIDKPKQSNLSNAFLTEHGFM
ncbi:MAG: riboflavin synthase [Candidatus Pristimantibacillus lignocellulolyticus]|uniref:Riboflavin synthase n=1 Tax=Candidatus Pristimantibacillus lignocellulolyticus TaxID=2994561 RepID=A0A9J6ZDR7_9BACL|nr:MAG: riboflavin synthase [Candidatus Pristimantibacillus lignocellulolyticus]